MDDLIADFLVETKKGLEILDNDLIALEKNPNNKEIIDNLFRVMHTIKGTCGFLGLSRLESVAHAGEDVMDKVRLGEVLATPEIISIILEAACHIKLLVAYLEENGSEQPGDDSALVTKITSYAIAKQSLQVIEPANLSEPSIAADNISEIAAEHKTVTKYEQEKDSPQIITVNIEVLEQLMQQASELVLANNQILQSLRTNNESISTQALQRLSNITVELQEVVTKTRKILEKHSYKTSDRSTNNILLVDDSQFFRKLIPPILEAVGFHVTTVKNGKDAVTKLKKATKYIAIITDMHMPGMNGQEFAILCRQNPELKDIPIIALSADRDGAKTLNHRKLENIDAFVSKTSPHELIQVLTNILKERNHERSSNS